MSGSYRLGDIELESRLIIGTGKYSSFEENRRALDASGAEMVTVAVRRVDLREREQTFTLEGDVQPTDVRLDPEHALLIWHPDYGERPE